MTDTTELNALLLDIISASIVPPRTFMFHSVGAIVVELVNRHPNRQVVMMEHVAKFISLPNPPIYLLFDVLKHYVERDDRAQSVRAALPNPYQ